MFLSPQQRNGEMRLLDSRDNSNRKKWLARSWRALRLQRSSGGMDLRDGSGKSKRPFGLRSFSRRWRGHRWRGHSLQPSNGGLRCSRHHRK